MVELKPTSGGKHKGSKSIYDQYKTLDDAYFSGVVVTHGSPRQHIWTFAAGAVENFTYILICVNVILNITYLFHHLLVKITSVSQDIYDQTTTMMDHTTL